MDHKSSFIDMHDCFATADSPSFKHSADSAHLQYDKNEFGGVKRGRGPRFHSTVHKYEQVHMHRHFFLDFFLFCYVCVKGWCLSERAWWAE